MGYTRTGPHARYDWKLQALAVLDQDPPVVNTWYAILDTVTGGILIQHMMAQQIHDEAGAETIEFRVTVDGIVLLASTSNNDSTWYKYNPAYDAVDTLARGTSTAIANVNGLYGHSIKVEVRQTTAVGTNAKLDGRVRYFQKVRI